MQAGGEDGRVCLWSETGGKVEGRKAVPSGRKVKGREGKRDMRRASPY